VNDVEQAAFRRAAGQFASGIVVVTTPTSHAMTVSAFTSVSLDPPLVLFSLARTARSLPAFAQASHWAVHILGAAQEELCGRFARSGVDKFAGLELRSGHGDAPLLEGCAARMQCRTAFCHEGGDHLIFVGEVLAFDRAEAQPLVFHGGRMRRLERLAA